MSTAVEADFNQMPQVLAQQFHCLLKQVAGHTDLFHSERKRCTQPALSLLPELKLRTESASDPLMTAVRFAIAGNVINIPENTRITTRNIRDSFHRALTEPFPENREEFRNSLKNANNILYLTDRAGEIVFDRLLIEQLLPAKVTVAVHGKPVFDNATINDAEACGLHETAKIIDKGSVSPGTFIDDCSGEFLDHYRNADLVIAKGLDNFESLNDQQQNIFFLFPVKCQVIASHTGYPVGAHLLINRIRLCLTSRIPVIMPIKTTAGRFHQPLFINGFRSRPFP